MSEQTNFHIGDWVKWKSQAGGYSKEKVGIVVSIIPPNQQPLIKGCGFARDHQTYLVEVGKKKYWPRVSALVSA